MTGRIDAWCSSKSVTKKLNLIFFQCAVRKIKKTNKNTYNLCPYVCRLGGYQFAIVTQFTQLLKNLLFFSRS